jgi:large subunit ribosomal protein L11
MVTPSEGENPREFKQRIEGGEYEGVFAAEAEA